MRSEGGLAIKAVLCEGEREQKPTRARRRTALRNGRGPSGREARLPRGGQPPRSSFLPTCIRRGGTGRPLRLRRSAGRRFRDETATHRDDASERLEIRQWGHRRRMHLAGLRCDFKPPRVRRPPGGTDSPQELSDACCLCSPGLVRAHIGSPGGTARLALGQWDASDVLQHRCEPGRGLVAEQEDELRELLLHVARAGRHDRRTRSEVLEHLSGKE